MKTVKMSIRIPRSIYDRVKAELARRDIKESINTYTIKALRMKLLKDEELRSENV